MRVRQLMLLAVGVLVLAGCSSGLTQALSNMGACRAASAVGVVPIGEPENVVEAIDAFLAEAPEELQQPLQLLRLIPERANVGAIDQTNERSGVDAADNGVEPSEQTAALRQVRAWVAEHCGSRFAMGALPLQVTDADRAVLDDFELVVGRDGERVSVVVAGVTRSDVALSLCEQATEAFRSQDGTLSVRVFAPNTRLIASNDSGACTVHT